MVVMLFPATSRMAVEHERMASPLRCTVHAPHSPAPQPNLAPVKSSSSRRYHKSGISGSPSNERSRPFTLTLIMIYILPFELWQRKREYSTARRHGHHLPAVHH